MLQCVAVNIHGCYIGQIVDFGSQKRFTGVLQCGVVCCSVLQRVAVCFSECIGHYAGQVVDFGSQLHMCVAVCCSVLQCVAVSVLAITPGKLLILGLRNALQVCCSVLQCVAACCNVVQCVAVCYSVLQRVAMWCSEFH